eukprot:TRINITY_DN6259_c0_g1_i1.p1 TRINITY_DN6259_c0_g1~~TRINITY_DN6259_c0_g1_i1.p1  ORF type:complete len:203 (-),score=51.35 TRINITY_DN6259_c0_g1_i1:9-575(-)
MLSREVCAGALLCVVVAWAAGHTGALLCGVVLGAAAVVAALEVIAARPLRQKAGGEPEPQLLVDPGVVHKLVWLVQQRPSTEVEGLRWVALGATARRATVRFCGRGTTEGLLRALQRATEGVAYVFVSAPAALLLLVWVPGLAPSWRELACCDAVAQLMPYDDSAMAGSVEDAERRIRDFTCMFVTCE